MRRAVIGLAVVVAACLTLQAAGAEAPGTAATGQPEKAAQAGAEQWLALLDADNYAESWKQAASIFKEKLTAQQWESAVKSVHSQTGKLLSRKFRTAESTSKLPGAPDGEYVILKYDSIFENLKTATETVVPTKDKDGSWRVSGYLIK